MDRGSKNSNQGKARREPRHPADESENAFKMLNWLSEMTPDLLFCNCIHNSSIVIHRDTPQSGGEFMRSLNILQGVTTRSESQGRRVLRSTIAERFRGPKRGIVFRSQEWGFPWAVILVFRVESF